MVSFSQARDVVFDVVGWSVRYLMVLRENYIGSFTHFSTLNEYLDKRRRGLPIGDPIVEKYRPGKVSFISPSVMVSKPPQTNVLQVELELSLSNGRLILPAGYNSFGARISVAVHEIQLQFRLHDYFMGN